MLLLLIWLVIALALGQSILKSWQSRFDILERLIFGGVIGLIVISLATFIIASLGLAQDLALGLSLMLSAGYLLGQSWRHLKLNQEGIRDWLKTELHQWRTLPQSYLWLLPLVVYLCLAISQLIGEREGQLTVGFYTVYGDYALHLRQIEFFRASPWLSLENPLIAGLKLNYPPLVNYLASLLTQTGLSSLAALKATSLLGNLALLLALFRVGRTLFRPQVGLLLTYLVVLSGGAGVLNLINDLWHGQYFWQASSYQPLLYTNSPLNLPNNQAYWLMNFNFAEFLPQRGFSYGLTLALLSWLEFYQWLKAKSSIKNPIQWGRVLTFALILASLILIHPHSGLTLGILLACNFLVLGWGRGWSVWRQPLLALGIASLGGGLLLKNYLIFGDSFKLHLIAGWLPDQTAASPAVLVLFWLKNAGATWLIGGIVGLIYWLKQAVRLTTARPASREALPLAQLLWSSLIAAWIIALLANFVQWQTWLWDNTKLLTLAYLLMSLPLAIGLADLLDRVRSPLSHARKLTTIAGLVLALLYLTGAGLADNLSVLSSSRQPLVLAELADRQAIQAVANRLLSPTPELTASWRQTRTRPVIASGTTHNHPISLFTGLLLYQGYEGWIHSYGFNFEPRLTRLRQFYAGNQTARDELIKQGVNYFLISNYERTQYQISPKTEADLTAKARLITTEGLFQLWQF